jgi:hypothetical protein
MVDPKLKVSSGSVGLEAVVAETDCVNLARSGEAAMTATGPMRKRKYLAAATMVFTFQVM